MRFESKTTQAGKEVTQMTKTFIPTDAQIQESVRQQMLYELVDEFSVDLLNSGKVDQAVALTDLSKGIEELSHTKSLETLAVFMAKRGYDLLNLVVQVILAFHLPHPQERALLNALAVLPTGGWSE